MPVNQAATCLPYAIGEVARSAGGVTHIAQAIAIAIVLVGVSGERAVVENFRRETIRQRGLALVVIPSAVNTKQMRGGMRVWRMGFPCAVIDYFLLTSTQKPLAPNQKNLYQKTLI